MLESDHTVQELIVQLPDEEDTFPSLLIRRSLKQEESRQEKHKHPLILEEYGRDMSCDLVCDACTQPINDISSPFYRCQSDGCHFLAHKMCSDNLPTNVSAAYGAFPLKGVHSDSSDEYFFNSVYSCAFCFLPSNGFVYHLFNKGSVSGFCDVECALAPKIIKHASHRQHLFQMMFLPTDSPQLMSCCSLESLQCDIYKCVVCDFCIHNRYAQLPKTTRHKFDHHPLHLITKSDHKTEHGHLFCEFCEEEIELKLWHYGCNICEQYFRINCIPPVGLLPKVKFGKTYDDRCLHQHPLTLTQMLTHGFHERCGVCNRIIKGFAEDEMAFHCSACNIWIHFFCASATTTGLLDYSQFQKEIEQFLRDHSIRPKIAEYDT